MLTPNPSPLGVLFCGLIASGEEYLTRAKKRTSKIWGPIAKESRTIPFDFTKYYEEEMGQGLLRQFLAFERIMPQEALPDYKHQAMGIEAGLGESSSRGFSRRVNIDPGYVALERVVLATTKNYSHRIYLRDGIFAEVTLIFRAGTFRALEWTYPDYRATLAIEFFNQVREEFKCRVRSAEC